MIISVLSVSGVFHTEENNKWKHLKKLNNFIEFSSMLLNFYRCITDNSVYSVSPKC